MKHPSDLPTYLGLLEDLARKCEGFSGAALAGVARAAASHALERAVNDFSEHANGGSDRLGTSSIMDCLVTSEDFHLAIEDVRASMGNRDHSDDEESSPPSGKAEDGEENNVSANDELSPE